MKPSAKKPSHSTGPFGSTNLIAATSCG